MIAPTIRFDYFMQFTLVIVKPTLALTCISDYYPLLLLLQLLPTTNQLVLLLLLLLLRLLLLLFKLLYITVTAVYF